MEKLTSSQLFSLEQYARRRNEFRAQVLEHKSHRRLAVGPNMTWCFEDRLTIQYQVQEMLRAEKVFEPEGIDEELGAYNPLIPDGSNWKATLLLEFPDETVRRARLIQLRGVEARCWVQVAGLEKVFAIADEDLPRENDEKTSAVHFLRFELSAPMLAALRSDAALAAGVDHEFYRHTVAPVAERIRASLLGDFN
ncbi:MAG TPA: DUF3501 family protein [Steroidobacteraceae bacterium]|jgi:hypothetical protein|nr:DUF3501 family protein [Steroidobacteraceae bacterium]